MEGYFSFSFLEVWREAESRRPVEGTISARVEPLLQIPDHSPHSWELGPVRHSHQGQGKKMQCKASWTQTWTSLFLRQRGQEDERLLSTSWAHPKVHRFGFLTLSVGSEHKILWGKFRATVEEDWRRWVGKVLFFPVPGVNLPFAISMTSRDSQILIQKTWA